MIVFTKKKLEEYLTNHNIPLDEWGIGKAKTIDHFLREVVRGESILKEVDGGIIREVKALSIIVRYKNLVLVEDCQIFDDGRVRKRKMEASVAEKIDKYDKNLIQSVIRGIKEELSISLDIGQITELGELDKEMLSMSYPGIITKIKLYKFLVILDDDQYISEGYMEIQEDKKTYFVWRES